MLKLFRGELLLYGLLLVVSCNSDDPPPDLMVTCDEITYSMDIKPIVNAFCAISGCHVPGTGRQNFLIDSIVGTNAEEMKMRTQIMDMPRIGALTPKEIDEIACWVDNGGLIN